MVDKTRIFVGGLPDGVRKEEMEDEFSRFGKLEDVWIARRPPGFAFVIYSDERDAKEAVRKMDGRSLCGRSVRVELARDSRERGSRDNGSRSRNDDRSCYNCGRPGHKSRDCYDARKNDDGRPYENRYRDSSPRYKRSNYTRDDRSRDSPQPKRSVDPPRRERTSRSYSHSN